MGCKLYGSTMLQKLPVSKFEWIKNTFEFNEDFIKNFNEKGDEGYFLKLIFNICKKYEIHNDLPSLPGRKKIEKLLLIYMIKLNTLFT